MKRLLPILFFLTVAPAWGQLTTSSSYNSNDVNLTVSNNTGSTLDDMAFDFLGVLIPNTYTLNLGAGAWLETGDTSDQYHTFAPVDSFFNLQNGQSMILNITYDTTLLANTYGIFDLTTLAKQTHTTIVLGEEVGGTQYFADAELRVFEAQVPTENVPIMGWVFVSLLGTLLVLVGVRQVKR